LYICCTYLCILYDSLTGHNSGTDYIIDVGSYEFLYIFTKTKFEFDAVYSLPTYLCFILK